MTLPSSVRNGARRPTHRTGPRARRSKGEDAAVLAELAGLKLDPWQEDVLKTALGLRSDGKWAAFEVGLVVPRQNGKGSILEALELHALFREPDCKLILHSAHEFKTAKEAFRRIVALIKANPKFAKRATVRYTVGEEGIELDDGSRLKFVARSSGSGRGFSGDLVILDEAYNLSDTMLSAMLPTMSARPNPQLWYTSSAPLIRPESDVLRKLCKRGRAGESQRLTYLEWCARGNVADGDRAAWAAANPSLGIRISEEFIENELEAMESEDFRRERLGIWVDSDESWLVIPRSDWALCLDHRSEVTGPPAFSLDVPPDRSSASFGVTGESVLGGLHVELVEQQPGIVWVVDYAVQLHETHRAPLAVAVGSPAWSLQLDLVAAGVDLVPVPVAAHAQACGAFYDDVVEHRVNHIGQTELDTAAAGADRKDYGDAWLWSRRRSSVDISPLVAVTLARWAHLNRPRSARPRAAWV